MERFINNPKQFRHITTRYDRPAKYFLACLHLAGAMISIRSTGQSSTIPLSIASKVNAF
jgi:hypothetical protein